VREELLLEEKLSRLVARRWCFLLLAAVVGLVAECCCRCSWLRRWSAGWNGAVAVQRGTKACGKAGEAEREEETEGKTWGKGSSGLC
jgi:hypothetical protein